MQRAARNGLSRVKKTQLGKADDKDEDDYDRNDPGTYTLHLMPSNSLIVMTFIWITEGGAGTMEEGWHFNCAMIKVINTILSRLVLLLRQT